MKRTDHSLELETIEEVDALFNAIEKSRVWNIENRKFNVSSLQVKEATPDDIGRFFSKGNDEMRTKDGKVLIVIDENYNKVQLSPDKIYFLSHPCTSGGDGEKLNREHEEEISQFIDDECKNSKIIRPLKIIPDNYDYDKAMRVCYTLLAVSNVAIFSPGFQTSRGCKDEHKYCIENEIPRLYIVAEDVSKVASIS